MLPSNSTAYLPSMSLRVVSNPVRDHLVPRLDNEDTKVAIIGPKIGRSFFSTFPLCVERFQLALDSLADFGEICSLCLEN